MIFKGTCIRERGAQLDFQEGVPERIWKCTFGASAGSQGTIGTRVQVRANPFGGLLDWEECARAQN